MKTFKLTYDENITYEKNKICCEGCNKYISWEEAIIIFSVYFCKECA